MKTFIDEGSDIVQQVVVFCIARMVQRKDFRAGLGYIDRIDTSGKDRPKGGTSPAL